jgi:MYXO-CTERM domain-containing protein
MGTVNDGITTLTRYIHLGGNRFQLAGVEIQEVTERSTLALFGLGLAGLVAYGRHRRRG